MNDCIWYWIDVCENYECRECKEYISEHCKVGEEMREAYERDVDRALEPVREEWARKKGANDA